MVANHREIKTRHAKRRGHHHPVSSKKYQKVYWPYLPLVVSILVSLFISDIRPMRPGQQVLAYATEMSIAGLLQATNQRRGENGSSALSGNAKLNQAAQNKANDMAARNYWSHNTPEGEEPWIFIDEVGYKYYKAGENLAYGFSTSAETVTGWINSPSHKANMLDTAFSEVGFGFANSADYQEKGPQTIVVAMYGKPQVLSESQTTSNSPPPASEPAQQTPAPQPVAPAAALQPANNPPPGDTSKPETKPAEEKPNKSEQAQQPTTTESPVSAAPRQIARAQTITGNSLPWAPFAIGLASGVAVILLLLKHSLAFRHFLKNSEKLVLHHPLLDSILISVILLSLVLSRTAGVIL